MNAELCRLWTRATQSPYWRSGLPALPPDFDERWKESWLKADTLSDLPEDLQPIAQLALLYVDVMQKTGIENPLELKKEVDKQIYLSSEVQPLPAVKEQIEVDIGSFFRNHADRKTG